MIWINDFCFVQAKSKTIKIIFIFFFLKYLMNKVVRKLSKTVCHDMKSTCSITKRRHLPVKNSINFNYRYSNRRINWYFVNIVQIAYNKKVFSWRNKKKKTNANNRRRMRKRFTLLTVEILRIYVIFQSFD